MKNYIDRDEGLGKFISEDLSIVKDTVRVFSTKCWKNYLSAGKRLIKEVDNCFGNNYVVIKRFLASSEDIPWIMGENSHDDATKDFRGLVLEQSPDGITFYPALAACAEFGPLSHI